MKFQSVVTAGAAGAILAHGQAVAGRKFKKGRVLRDDDIHKLIAAGVNEVVVAELDSSDASDGERES